MQRWTVSQNVPLVFSRGSYFNQLARLINSSADNLEVGMLIPQCCSHISVSHCLHNRCQVSGVLEQARTEVNVGYSTRPALSRGQPFAGPRETGLPRPSGDRIGIGWMETAIHCSFGQRGFAAPDTPCRSSESVFCLRTYCCPARR